MTDQQLARGGDGNWQMPPHRSLTVVDLIRVPMRRWLITAICASVGALLGLLLSTVDENEYAATATVVVRPVVTDPFTYPGPGAERSVNMNVEREIARGVEVTAAVARATGDDVELVGEALEVEVPDGSQVLRFRYTATTPKTAALGADTAATSYLLIREGMFQQQKEKLLASYDESIDQATEQRDKIVQQLPTRSSSGTQPRIDGLLAGVRALDDQLNQLGQQRARISSVDISSGVKTGSQAVGEPATLKGPPLMVVLGVAIGLIFAVLASYVREAADRRIRSNRDAIDVTGLPMLGEMRRNASGTTGLVDSGYLALAVVAQLDQAKARSLAVLTAHADEGGTRVAAELAVMLAKEGLAVQVHDRADREDELRTRIRGLASLIGRAAAAPRNGSPPMATAPTTAQVGDTAADTAADTAVIPKTRADNDTVRTSPGPRVADGTLGVDAGSVLIGDAEVADGKDVTIINAAPADSDVDGIRAASEAAALLVVAKDRSRVADVQRLIDRLRLTGGTPLGFVYVSRHD